MESTVIRKTKKLRLEDEQRDTAGAVDGNNGTFYENFLPVATSCFQVCPGKRKSNKTQVVIQSDTFVNQSNLLCGFDNDQLLTIDVSQAASEVIELPPKSGAILHPGLSCARCSKNTPQVFFSSSAGDGKIYLWDTRVKSTKPAQTFVSSINQDAKRKPILTFDISQGDQLLCAGTELVDEDAFLLFWDLRSTQLLGAYWESHSDDVTSVKFHPTKPNLLASGSTDGLLNVFNLMEVDEEEALQYSFNTETSVEKICWNSPVSKPTSDHVACITHLNDFRTWDIITGDSVANCDRSAVAKAMQRSNPDTTYLNDCYAMTNGTLGLFSCSLSGDSCGTLEVVDGELTPRALFLTETSVIQRTEYLSRDNCWVTFNDQGTMGIWSIETATQETNIKSSNSKLSRFNPY